MVTGLEAEHYSVTLAANGEEGYFLATTQGYDLILLDIMLPGRDGIEFLNALRTTERRTPVLILSALGEVEDRVRGLDTGADDYLVKPFAFPELLARIRALTRRGRGDELLRYRIADLEIDCVTRHVTRGGVEVGLTAKEYELLEYFARNHGHTVSREMIAHDVWHGLERSTPIDNVIDVHMTRLRRKLDGDSDSPLLHTIRGVGYRLGPEKR